MTNSPGMIKISRLSWRVVRGLSWSVRRQSSHSKSLEIVRNGIGWAVSKALGREIELRLNSELEYLDLVQAVSDNVCLLAGFDSDDQYWIGLAVREAVTNAIQHGNNSDSAKQVVLVFRICEDRLKIAVRDQGEGIKDLDIPDPLDPLLQIYHP